MGGKLLPYIAEPHDLHINSGESKLIIVDLGSEEEYTRGHIPGAVYLEYARLRLANSPTLGLLPAMEELESTFSDIGALEKINIDAESCYVIKSSDQKAIVFCL